MDLAGLMQLASTQFGLFSREQAIGHGFTLDAIKWKLRTKDWERVRWGVFRVRGIHSTWSQSARGVLLQAGEGAALSHGTAAFVHGLDGFKRDAPRIFDVTSPRRLSWSDSTVRMHLSHGPIPVETVRGLTVTSLARTVHDLTGILKAEPLEQAFDSARRARSLFPRDLDRYLATLDQDDLGSITLRQIIAERASPLDSAPEVILYREALKRGLPKPIPGYSVFDDDKKFVAKVDLGWKEEKVAAMFDSYLHHSSRAAFDKDARQRAKLQRAHWAVVGVTKRLLPDSVWSDAIKELLNDPTRRESPQK